MTDQIVGILTSIDDFIVDVENAKTSIINFTKESEINIFAIIQAIDYAGEHRESLNKLFKFICENLSQEDISVIAKAYYTFLIGYESPTIEAKLNFIIYTCTSWFDHINFMSVLLNQKMSNRHPVSFLQFIISYVENPVINKTYYSNVDLLVQLFEFLLINYKQTFITIYERNVTDISFDQTKYEILNTLQLNEKVMSYYFTHIRILEKLWETYSESIPINECLDNKYDYCDTKNCMIRQYKTNDVDETKERDASILECLFYNYSTLLSNIYLTALSKRDRLLDEIAYYEGLPNLYENPFTLQQYSAMQEYYYEWCDILTDNISGSVSRFYSRLSHWIHENMDTLYKDNTKFFNIMLDSISLYMLFSYKETRYDISEIMQLSLKTIKEYDLISNPHIKIRILKNIYNYVLKNEDGLVYIYFDYFKNDILRTLINFYVNIEFNDVSLERSKVSTRFTILHFIHFLKDNYTEHYSEQFQLFKVNHNVLYNKFVYMILSESSSVLNGLFKCNEELVDTKNKLAKIKDKFGSEKLENAPKATPVLNFENLQNGQVIQLNLNNLNNLQNMPGLNQQGQTFLQNVLAALGGLGGLFQQQPEANQPENNNQNLQDLVNMLNTGMQPPAIPVEAVEAVVPIEAVEPVEAVDPAVEAVEAVEANQVETDTSNSNTTDENDPDAYSDVDSDEEEDMPPLGNNDNNINIEFGEDGFEDVLDDDGEIDDEIDDEIDENGEVVNNDNMETMTEERANALFHQYTKTIKYITNQIDICYNFISEMFEMIIYLESNRNKGTECFVTEEIADHLAEILSYYLMNIGKNNVEDQMLKTLLYIAKMYSLLIANDVFVQTIKNNIELFPLEQINGMIGTLSTNGLLNEELNEKLSTLVAMVDSFKSDKSNMDPINLAHENSMLPDKFYDPIFCTPIRNAVMLPTSDLAVGIIMDEVCIKRYLISNHSDPTNRQPLTTDSLNEFNSRENVRVKLAEFTKERDDWISTYIESISKTK